MGVETALHATEKDIVFAKWQIAIGSPVQVSLPRENEKLFQSVISIQILSCHSNATTWSLDILLLRGSGKLSG